MFGPSLRGNARYIRVFVCRHLCMYTYMLFLTQLVSIQSLAYIAYMYASQCTNAKYVRVFGSRSPVFPIHTDKGRMVDTQVLTGVQVYRKLRIYQRKPTSFNKASDNVWCSKVQH